MYHNNNISIDIKDNNNNVNIFCPMELDCNSSDAYNKCLTKMYNNWPVFNNEYHDEILKMFHDMGKGDDASFQCRIGNMFYNKCDYKNAFIWYHKSAVQEYSQGQYNLAQMYEKGEGVKKNYKKMIKWYKKAKENGHDLAEIRYRKIIDKNIMDNVMIKNSFGEILERCVSEYIKTFTISSRNSNDLSKFEGFLKIRSKKILPGIPMFDISGDKVFDKVVEMGMYMLERNKSSDFEDTVLSSDISGSGYSELKEICLDERIKNILLNITRD